MNWEQRDLMVSEKDLRKFAKAKGYALKEVCTGRYELSKQHELMIVKAVVDKNEKGIKVSTSPNFIPIILLCAVLAAAFPPLVVLVYFLYASLAWVRVSFAKRELKKIGGG